MDTIIKKVTSLNLGYGTGNKRIRADDAAIIVESENDLQRQLFHFFQTSHQLNTNISTGKTKYMIIVKEPLRCKLVLEDKPIEQVMQFRYEGVHISSTYDLRSQNNSICTVGMPTRYSLVKPVRAHR